MICSSLDMMIQYKIEKTEMTDNNSWSCIGIGSKGGLYYEDSCRSLKNEQWQDSYVLFIAFVILQHLERTVFGDTSFDGGHVLWQQKIER
jgi:hypothetical protein